MNCLGHPDIPIRDPTSQSGRYDICAADDLGETSDMVTLTYGTGEVVRGIAIWKP